eukprot:SAG11_NODE_1046_length_6042_cov_12.954400_2_plen_111_part_00
MQFEDLDDMEKSFICKGTCQTIEKKYFRLTSAPDPAVVRPIEVLRKSLQHVKEMWKKKSNYEWCSDQMKGIRQDLTLQARARAASHAFRNLVLLVRAAVWRETAACVSFG